MYKFTDNTFKLIMERQGFKKERIEEILNGNENHQYKTLNVTREEMELLMTDIEGTVHIYSAHGEMSILNPTTLRIYRKYEERLVNKIFGWF